MEIKDKVIIGVTIATLIVSIGTLVVMYFGTIVNPTLENKPVVSVYLGNEQQLPISLLWDYNIFPSIQYANIYLSNSGKTKANFDITLVSNNATISFDKQTWSSNQTRLYSLDPTQNTLYKIYVKPNLTTNSFSIALTANNLNPSYGELDTPNEQKSIYRKTFDGRWEWNKQG